MNPQSNELEKLKNRILGQADSDTEQTRVLIQIMREVGGYEQLINMPISAIKQVYDFLKWEAKEFEKKMPKAKRKW